MKVVECLKKNEAIMTRAQIAVEIDIEPSLVTDIFKNRHLKKFFIKSRKGGELMKYDLSPIGLLITKKDLDNLTKVDLITGEKPNNSKKLLKLLVPRVGELYC